MIAEITTGGIVLKKFDWHHQWELSHAVDFRMQ
jgi:hypothetical protein